MKFLKPLSIIFACTFAGELMRYTIPLPVPANIYGILLLFLLLVTKIVPLSSVETTGNFLIDFMPVMFIPAGVGIISSWQSLSPILIPYIAILVISTIIVMCVTANVADVIISNRGDK